MKHELLLELLSKPVYKDHILLGSDLSDTSSSEILEFRRFLQFNEQEILVRPFTLTKDYLTYEEIEKVSSVYFSKYGLRREIYTKKVKAYGLNLLKFLYRNRKPNWLIDIARYEYMLFSQLWFSKPNNQGKINSQSNLDKYQIKNSCKLGRFSFDVENYMKSPKESEFLFKHLVNTYLVFIGNSELPSVSIKNVGQNIYYLLRFCTEPKSILEIDSFLASKFLLYPQKYINTSYDLIDLLTTWNMLEKNTATNTIN